jgi:hypothetical protein
MLGQLIAAYDDFFGLSTVAGNPAILKLNKTLEATQRFLAQNSAAFPDLQKAFSAAPGTKFNFKSIEDLAGFDDPLVQFMSFANGVARSGPITFEQYKGVAVMLNRALEQTSYQTVSKSVASIREALEKDAHGFLRELNVPSLLGNKDIQQKNDRAWWRRCRKNTWA